MNYYHPDKFKILKIQSEGLTTYKVLAGWQGGFFSTDSWRLNSGIKSVRVSEFPEYFEYEFIGYSGSIYNCADITEGFTNLSYDVLQDYIKKIKESDITIEVIHLKDFLKEFDGEIEYEYTK